MVYIVTLATRVRIKILKLIARKCSSSNEEMFVMGLSSRPVLQVKKKDRVPSFPTPSLTLLGGMVIESGGRPGSGL